MNDLLRNTVNAASETEPLELDASPAPDLLAYIAAPRAAVWKALTDPATVKRYFFDTDLVTGAFEDPLVQRIRDDVTPGWMTRKVPTSKAARVVINALEKRQPRAIAPAEWKAMFYGRGILCPLFDKRVDEDQAIAQIIPEAENRQRA